MGVLASSAVPQGLGSSIWTAGTACKAPGVVSGHGGPPTPSEGQMAHSGAFSSPDLPSPVSPLPPYLFPGPEAAQPITTPSHSPVQVSLLSLLYSSRA